MIELKATTDSLYCIISGEKRFKFIDLSQLKILLDEDYFEKVEKKNSVELL